MLRPFVSLLRIDTSGLVRPEKLSLEALGVTNASDHKALFDRLVFDTVISVRDDGDENCEAHDDDDKEVCGVEEGTCDWKIACVSITPISPSSTTTDSEPLKISTENWAGFGKTRPEAAISKE